MLKLNDAGKGSQDIKNFDHISKKNRSLVGALTLQELTLEEKLSEVNDTDLTQFHKQTRTLIRMIAKLEVSTDKLQKAASVIQLIVLLTSIKAKEIAVDEYLLKNFLLSNKSICYEIDLVRNDKFSSLPPDWDDNLFLQHIQKFVINSNQTGKYYSQELANTIHNKVNQILQNAKPAIIEPLYEGIKEYNANYLTAYRKRTSSNDAATKEQTYFRGEFVDFLKQIVASSNHIFTGSLIERELKPETAMITLEEFIGKEGLRKYQLALEEESLSIEFMNFCIYKSTKEYKGKKWAERPIWIMGGASSTGKSHAADKAVEFLLPFLKKDEKSDDNYTNYVIWVDGGIIRKASQMRKLLIKVANAKGFSMISNLHEHSYFLEKVKTKILNFALQNNNPHGVVIPETFASYLTTFVNHPLLDKVVASQNSKVFFCRVVGKNPQEFPEVVRFMGSMRACKSDWTTIIDLDMNSDEDLCESKIYERQYFIYGENGTTRAEIKLNLMLDGNYVSVIVVNDLVLKKEEYPNEWVKAEPEDPKVIKVSEAIFNNWKQSQLSSTNPQSLIKYMEDENNWVPTQIKLTFAVNLEEKLNQATTLNNFLKSQNTNDGLILASICEMIKPLYDRIQTKDFVEIEVVVNTAIIAIQEHLKNKNVLVQTKEALQNILSAVVKVQKGVTQIGAKKQTVAHFSISFSDAKSEEDMPFNFILPNFCIGSPSKKGHHALPNEDDIINAFNAQGRPLGLIVQAIRTTVIDPSVYKNTISAVETVVININDFNSSDNESIAALHALNQAKEAIKKGKGIYVDSTTDPENGYFIATMLLVTAFNLSYDEAQELIYFIHPQAEPTMLSSHDEKVQTFMQALSVKVIQAQKSSTKKKQNLFSHHHQEINTSETEKQPVTTRQRTGYARFSDNDLPIGRACYLSDPGYAIELRTQIHGLYSDILTKTNLSNNDIILKYTNKIILFIKNFCNNKFLTLENLRDLYLPALCQKLDEYIIFTQDKYGNPLPGFEKNYQFFCETKNQVEICAQKIREQQTLIATTKVLASVNYNYQMIIELRNYISENYKNILTTNKTIAEDFQTVDKEINKANSGNTNLIELKKESELNDQIDILMALSRIGFSVVYSQWKEASAQGITNDDIGKLLTNIIPILQISGVENANSALTHRGRLAYIDHKLQEIDKVLQQFYQELLKTKFGTIEITAKQHNKFTESNTGHSYAALNYILKHIQDGIRQINELLKLPIIAATNANTKNLSQTTDLIANYLSSSEFNNSSSNNTVTETGKTTKTALTISNKSSVDISSSSSTSMNTSAISPQGPSLTQNYPSARRGNFLAASRITGDSTSSAATTATSTSQSATSPINSPQANIYPSTNPGLVRAAHFVHGGDLATTTSATNTTTTTTTTNLNKKK